MTLSTLFNLSAFNFLICKMGMVSSYKVLWPLFQNLMIFPLTVTVALLSLFLKGLRSESLCLWCESIERHIGTWNTI